MSTDLKKEFFESILRKYENDDSINVHEIQKKNGCSAGENFMSEVNEIIVQGTRVVDGIIKDYQTSLIIKQQFESEMGTFLQAEKAFLNEVCVYNIIIPAYKKILKHISLPVPTCLYADPKIIVLENLKSKGYESLLEKQGLDIPQCAAFLKELSKLHAASIIVQQKQPEVFQQLLQSLKPVLFYTLENQQPVMSLLQIRLHLAIKVFNKLDKSQDHDEILKMLKDLEENFHSLPYNLLWSPRNYRVINHGDPWFNNVLFGKNDLKLVDLQIARYTSVGADLCYLFFVNIQPKLLTKNLDYLLNTYLEALHENLLKNDVNMKNVLTKEWLRHELHDFAPFGFAYGLLFMPIYFFKQEDADTTSIIKEMQLGADYMLTKYIPPLKDRVVSLIKEYVKYLQMTK